MIYFDTKVVKSTIAGLLSKKELIVHEGGTSSGKTFGIMAALIRYALSLSYRLTITICAVNFPYIRRDTLRAFKDITTEMGIRFTTKSESTYTYTIGHCIFEFIGLEDPGKASHGKRDILWCNEAYLIPYMVYQNLAIRAAQTTILDYNPHEDFWLQESVIKYQPAGSYLFKRSTYLDNPAVSGKIARNIEQLKESNPNLYRVLGLGLKGALEGLCFPNIEIVDSFPRDCKRQGYGIDFGYANDPTAIYNMGLHNGNVYIDEICYETGLLNDDIVQVMYENQMTNGDTIIADSEDPKSIAEINKKGGYSIKPATKGPDSVNYGISLINQYPIKITKRSSSLLKEQKNYRWKVDKNNNRLNVPVDGWDHGWDACRYIGLELLTPNQVTQRKMSKFQR